MERQSWLENLTQGHVVIEASATAQTLVRIEEIKRGRIWYSNVTGVADLRCVDGATGRSSDCKRHLLPQDPSDPDEDDVWYNHICPLKKGAITTI